ncbi:MAG: TIR domain-containing protein [Anaerolinea sp.]|nr:TIR domain-containing protein [Anaerolinea sp.]
MLRLFINYRRQDSEGYAGRLYDHLLRHFEREQVFIDVDNIPAGADFVQALEDAVAACDVLIALIGLQWLTIADDAGQRRLHQWNDFVRIEIASALRMGKFVVPVLVGGASMPSPTDLPEDLVGLARRNAVALGHHSFAYDVDKLVAAIKDAVPANESFKPRPNSETLRRKDDALRGVRSDVINAVASPLYTCRVENGYFPVFGEGSADANLMFIGEAPGKNEAKQGRPFIGPSGMVLDEMLGVINLKRADVFVTNLLLDCPPSKREPTPEEIAFYEPFVNRIIDIVQPAVIAPLGRFATSYVLRRLGLAEHKGKIGELHGRLIRAAMPYGYIHVVPLYHPAVVLYSASQKELLRKDFEKLKVFV